MQKYSNSFAKRVTILNFKMLLKKIFKERFLFIKIQSFITILILIPIIIVGSAFNNQFESVLSNNFSEANRNVLQQTSVAFDLFIDGIIDVTKQAYFDEGLNHFLIGGDTDNAAETKKIMEKLDKIKSLSPYIHSVYLYIPKDRKVISTDYGICNVEEFGGTQFLNWYESESKNLVLEETHEIPYYKGSAQKDDVFSVYTKLPFMNTSDFRGALIVNIGQSLVYKEVMEKLKVKEDVSLFVLNKDDEIIISNDNKNIYKNIYSMNYFQEKMTGENGDFVTFMNDSPYLVAYTHMDKRDWTYVYMYPMEEIYSTIAMIKNLILYLSILLFLLGSIISFLFIFRTFKPVEELISLIKQKTQMNERGARQLGGVKAAVSELFQDNEDMKQKLEMTLPVYREKFLQGLIHGSGVQEKEMEAKLNSFAIDIPLENLILAIFQVDDYEETLDRWDGNGHLMNFAMHNVLQHISQQRNSKFFSVDLDSGSMAAVFGIQQLKMGELLKILMEIQEALHQSLRISVTIGVCDHETGIGKLGESYYNAKEVLKYKILYGKKEILLFSDIRQEQEHSFIYPYDKVELLKNYIKVCDGESALKELKEVLEMVSQKNRASYHSVYQMIVQLNNSMMNLLNEVNIQLEVIYYGNMIENMMKMKSMVEIEVFFTSIIRKMISILVTNRESKMDRYFHNIMEYIQDHYMMELSLEALSEAIHISPSYINQILKKSLDKTFIQLLNDVRVNKAYEYLLQGDMKIKEVAEKVGFSSSAYFIKIFKEIKGITPGQLKQ
jgi:AraC-like DNA-binding protein